MSSVFTSQRKRRGFTLVELLVVIAIIGILIALLLPAVQAAREAARRSECANNMKQIALALHNYESSFKKYPAAGRGYGMCPGAPRDGEVKNSNGLVSLLPYLEQMALYERFDHRTAYSIHNGRSSGSVVGDPVANGNARLSETIINAFLCPSDNNEPRDRCCGPDNTYYGPGGGLKGAATNYDFIVSSHGDFGDQNYWQNAGIERRMFGQHSESSPATVTDGLSNTFALGETTKYHVNGSGFAWAFRGWVMTGIDPHPSTRDAGINLWHMPWVDPTWQSPPFVPARGRTRTWWSAAASLHPGGCQFAMGDASVRFISETIDKPTLLNLSRMGDGQVVTVPN